jgi:hypothetical protein
VRSAPWERAEREKKRACAQRVWESREREREKTILGVGGNTAIRYCTHTHKGTRTPPPPPQHRSESRSLCCSLLSGQCGSLLPLSFVEDQRGELNACDLPVLGPIRQQGLVELALLGARGQLFLVQPLAFPVHTFHQSIVQVGHIVQHLANFRILLSCHTATERERGMRGSVRFITYTRYTLTHRHTQE